MKIFLTFAVLLAAVWAADDWKVHPIEEMMAFRSKCIQEHQVPEALVEKMKKFEYEDQPNVHCSLNCVAQAAGVWNTENGWILDRLYEQALPEAAIPNKEDLKKCIDARLEGENDCKWTYRNFKCMIDNKLIAPKEL